MKEDVSFKDAIVRPQAALEAWTQDPAHRASAAPGLRWIVTFELVLGAVLLALSWLLVAALEAVAKSLGDETQQRLSSLIPSALRFSGMTQELFELGVAVLVAVAVATVGAWVLVWVLDRDGGRERRNQALNVLAKMTLPWRVFVVVPVLGWAVALVGSVYNGWRSVAHLFAARTWDLRLRGILLGGLAGLLTALLLRSALSALLALSLPPTPY